MKIPFPRVSFGLIVLLATLRSNALNAMETSTNIHWLTPNAEVSTAGGGTYYGAAGFEIITVSGADQIIVDGNVDKIVLGGFRNDYQKSIQGTRIQLTSDTQGGVTFSGLNNPVVLSFADGDYSLQLAALDWAFLGTEPLVDWGVGAALVASAVARSEATQVPAPASWENRLTSSSQLDLSWNTPTGSYDHIQLVLTNTQTGQVEYRTLPTNEIRTLSATESGYRATGLNSGTDYNINLRLCLASDCAQFKTSATVAAQTSEEYWWLQGTGNSASTVSKVIEDGNTKPFAFAMGKDAPSELQGLVQLYYNPMKSNVEKGQQNRIPATSMAGSEADPAR
ncbi:MAG: hypothetical protein KDI30_08965, partial [Pseudomonadales bacterium]|nr:hypothetical protein [Pseudomonadales bacterium]